MIILYMQSIYTKYKSENQRCQSKGIGSKIITVEEKVQFCGISSRFANEKFQMKKDT